MLDISVPRCSILRVVFTNCIHGISIPTTARHSREHHMSEKRFVHRTVCRRDVTFHWEGRQYNGAIENMSNYGASILAKWPGQLEKGTPIEISISCDGQEDKRKASVVWSEEGVFGAKFI